MSEFPLPEGYTRVVTRPNRKDDRKPDARVATRMVLSALKWGTTPEELCAEFKKEGVQLCKVDCGDIVPKLENFIDYMSDADTIELLDLLREFLEDMESIVGDGSVQSRTLGARLRRLNPLKRLKWLLWIYRLYGLIAAVREVLRIWDFSLGIAREALAQLERVCEQQEEGDVSRSR